MQCKSAKYSVGFKNCEVSVYGFQSSSSKFVPVAYWLCTAKDDILLWVVLGSAAVLNLY